MKVWLSVSILLLVGSFRIGWARPTDVGNSLYQGFRNPPSKYNLIPLWTWNGKINANIAKHQIDLMLAQGIRRAIVYPFPNMRIRFLSENWWRLWGEILAYARQKGFQLGVNVENEYPDGDARDQYLPPPDQSHVLLGHPEYHMKRLAYVEREFVGPGPVRFSDLPDPLIAVAVRNTGPGKIHGTSLTDMSSGISGSSFSGELPAGDWRLMFFHLENTIGPQGGHIDPLNHAAVARFIDLTLGEYYRRFKQYFGNTFTFVLADDEGSYGRPIAWTPALFDTFRREKGYDLKKSLPLLVYDGGKLTPKVRIDYLNVISDLYARNYWGQIAHWCEAHGLQMTAQGLSDSLLFDASRGGEYMQMMRQLTMPGVEALGNRGRSPREFVEDESIADFEGRRYWCEGPLVLGADTYVSPQKERYTANMLAHWGINLWAPQFYMDPDSLDWPPGVFVSQPWWKLFRHYTNYVRRISYMNGGGKHVVDLLLYRPTDTIFAFSNPFFKQGQQNRAWPGSSFTPDSTATLPSTTSEIRDSGYERGPFGMPSYPVLVWSGNYAATVETAYFDLMEMLTGYQKAYDVVDDYYLQRMKLEQGMLRIAGLSFRGMVLPPMKVISRKALSKIREFYEQGGLVVAYGNLPSASSEEGRDDPVVAEDIKAIFGVDPGWKQDAQNQNAQGGKAYFVVGNIEHILTPLNRNLEADLEVIHGPRNRLIYSHRVKDSEDLYWIVNDTDSPRQVVVSVTAQGKAELWDPATGERRETAYWMKDGRTIVPLSLQAWDATYLVLTHAAGKAVDMSIARTNLEKYRLIRKPRIGAEVQGEIPAADQNIYVEGELRGKAFRIEKANSRRVEPQTLSPEGWRFLPAEKQVTVRYARERVVGKGEGLEAGYALPFYNDQTWEFSLLSPRDEIIHRWWVLGPFPNPDYGKGFNIVFPPEKKIELDGSYRIAQGEEIGWRHYQTTQLEINLSKALGSDPHDANCVGYATTWVYVPRAIQVEALIVGKNVKLWVNGGLIFARNNAPQYFELRDAFGFERKVALKAGWNQVLVKVAGAQKGSALIFYLRFTDSRGAPVAGLMTSWDPTQAELAKEQEKARTQSENLERWYRVQIPGGTAAFLLPRQATIQSVYLNGREVKPHDGQVRFPRLDFNHPQVLALRMEGRDKLREPLRFESAETEYHLGNWTGTGLTYYAGSASYEKEFTLDPKFQGDRIVLDCGRVGVVAEVWLNGQKVGDRLWKPFAIDVSKYVKPGKNQLRIVVTNESDAAMRAIPDFGRYLQMLDLAGTFLSYPGPYRGVVDPNGLLGPVRLIPYREVRLSIPAP